MSDSVFDADGDELVLGRMPTETRYGYTPRCCTKARYIENHKGDGPFSDNPGKYTCVCDGKSYCPEHGIQCNGSHS